METVGKGGDANTTVTGNLGVTNGDNPDFNTNCGYDGKSGENCGNISVNDDVKIYAYGGSGGSGGTDETTSAGGGRRWIPCCWNRRRRSRPEAGGNHCDGAGGFSGGGGEQNGTPGYNGFGGGNSDSAVGSAGGGYFTRGLGKANARFGTGAVGGMTGTPFSGLSDSRTDWCFDHAGSGGKGGAGGNITYTKASNIFAYNGDMITNNSYTNVNEYGWSSTSGTYKMDSTLEPIVKNVLNSNGTISQKNFIPCKIFAQSGIIRETYTTNQRSLVIG